MTDNCRHKRTDESVHGLASVRRLLTHVRVNENGCWVYTGYLRKGYARVNRGNSTYSGHRLVYEALRGAIHDEFELDHLCRDRACVNPMHLEAVPHRVNILRGESNGALFAKRTHCNKGHALTSDNIHWRADSKSGRRCRACMIADSKTRYRNIVAQKKESHLAP